MTPGQAEPVRARASIIDLSSPDDFGRFVESEVNRWAKVVKDNNIVVKD